MISVIDIVILKNKISSLHDTINQCLEDSELVMNIMARFERSSQDKDQLYFANETYRYAVMLRSRCIAAIEYIDLILKNLTFLEMKLTETIAH